MISRTVTIFRRYAKTWRGNRLRKDDTHLEEVVRETWWFCGVIPLLSLETIRNHNL